MKKLIMIITIFTILSASARMGETKEQCIKRYGTPEMISGDNNLKKLKFRKSKIQIVIFLKNNKCIMIAYKKLDDTKLTANQIKTVLKANSNQEWNPWITKYWITSNGLFVAFNDVNIFSITTKKYLLEVRKQIKEKEDQDLDGI